MKWLKWFILCYVMLIPQPMRVFMEYEYEIKFNMTNWLWFFYGLCFIFGWWLAVY